MQIHRVSLPRQKARIGAHARITARDILALKKLKRQYPPKQYSKTPPVFAIANPTASHPYGQGVGGLANALNIGATGTNAFSVNAFNGSSTTNFIQSTGATSATLTVSSSVYTSTAGLSNGVIVYSANSGRFGGRFGVGVNSISLSTLDKDAIDNAWKMFVGAPLLLPDGTKILIDDKGNYIIEDKDAKIVRRGSNVREFNRFINASDQLEAFIKDLGVVGVTQGKVLKIPIEVFINWLVIKAAEQDQTSIPDGVVKLESQAIVRELTAKGRCLCCGKYLSQARIDKKVNFCSGDHLERYLQKQN